MGLKRFALYNKNSLASKYKADKEALKIHRQLLEEQISISSHTYLDKNNIINIIEELFYGYSAVLMTRQWFAQFLLPLSEKMLYPEKTIPKVSGKKRDKIFADGKLNDFDEGFKENKRNFLARGGEVYFLHIMLSLNEKQENENKVKLEQSLERVLKTNTLFSSLSTFVEKNWERYKQKDNENLKNYAEVPLGWIPNNDIYKECGKLAVKELLNFLNSSIDPIRKIELFAKGMMLQLLRLIARQAYHFSTNDLSLYWIASLVKEKRYKKDFVSLCSQNYQNNENIFTYAVSEMKRKMKEEKDRKLPKDNTIKIFQELFRKKGKEIGLIIPYKGPNMRFTLSEDLIFFLVLSLVEPGKKKVMNTFLNDLYDHFGIIIGHEKYESIEKKEKEYVSYFEKNLEEFQKILYRCGFLRELSDSTAIVENPYGNS